MSVLRCPGQDIRFWKPKDIFSLRCPYCGAEIEFWKDDPFRKCQTCGQTVSNPRIDLGCAKWCKYAEKCLGLLPNVLAAEAPVIDRLTALLEQHLTDQPTRMKYAREVCALAEAILAQEGGEPYIVKSAALLAGALLTQNGVVSSDSSFNATGGDDSAAWQTLFEHVGIETSKADEIYAIVSAVISGRTYDTPECNIVWDAVQLERLALIQDSETWADDPLAIMDMMKTQRGKQMAGR